MGQNMGDVSNFTDNETLRAIDRRNNIILGASIISMLSITLVGVSTELLPTLWGEMSIVIVIGLIYNWGKQKQRIDLRLGCVYSAVGIFVSFVLVVVGLLGMILVVAYLPFLIEIEGFLRHLPLVPFVLSTLIAYKIAEPLGIRVAKKQWLRIDQKVTILEEDYPNPATLYLVEKKWTKFDFYLLLIFIVELLPLFLRYLNSSTLFITIILVGFFIYLLGRAYFIQKESESRQ